MSDNPDIVEVTDANFEQTVIARSHSAPVLVDFWAQWCQPCKQMLPTLLKLVDEFAGGCVLGKLNIDEQRTLAAEAGVRSVPTVLVFRKGVVVDQFLGVQPESVIRDIIERNLFRASDQLMAQAAEAAQQGDRQEAARRAREAVALESERGDLRFELAIYLAGAGEWDAAEAEIDALPREIREAPETDALRARIDLQRAAVDAPDRRTLEDEIGRHPNAVSSRYQLAARCLEAGDPQSALDQLLAIVRQDRGYRDDAGRKGMLAIFALLGDDHPLAHDYRSRMFNALH